MEKILVCIVIGYLFGCFQSSYFVGKIFRKVDIRQLGNGNAGASNTTIVLGWKLGILVGLLDILKPILSIIVIRYIFKANVDNSYLSLLLYLNGLFVIIGHNFPFFMKFKGGKGTASLVGMLIAIDIRMGIIGILAIVIITIITDYIAVGTFGLVISFLVMTMIFDYSIGCILIATMIAIMSIYKHKINIIRIMKGTETRLRQTLKK